MKKLLTGFFVFTLITNTQAISLDSTAKAVTTVVDGTIVKSKEVANSIDTSRLSKQVYSDVKQALVGLGQALKVGAEHVYKVLVMQQVVKAIEWTILGLVPFLLLLVFGKASLRWANKDEGTADDQGVRVLITCIFWIACLIGMIIFVFHVNTIVTGFVNPEYGAMLDIMDFIKTIKGGN